MNDIERRLAEALLGIWPRCHLCGAMAQYRMAPATGWAFVGFCEEHRPSLTDGTLMRLGPPPKFERIPGYEAIEEIELLLANERVEHERP